MDLREKYGDRTLDAEKAVEVIKPGSRVFIVTGCGEPQHLIRAMVADDGMHDIMLYQVLSSTLSHFVDDEDYLGRFSLKLFFISWSMRKAASVVLVLTADGKEFAEKLGRS